MIAATKQRCPCMVKNFENIATPQKKKKKKKQKKKQTNKKQTNKKNTHTHIHTQIHFTTVQKENKACSLIISLILNRVEHGHLQQTFREDAASVQIQTEIKLC